MTDCTDYEGLLAGLLDGELTADETHALTTHLERCAACRADYDLLREETGVLDRMAFAEPGDAEVAAFWRLPGMRAAQNWAMTLVIGGYLGFIGYGLYSYFTSPVEHLLSRLGLGAIVAGGAVLIGIVVVERWLRYPSDPYKDVER